MAGAFGSYIQNPANSLTTASVVSGEIASGSVSTFSLASGAVTATQMGSGSVASGSIASGSVSRFAMASGAVNSGQVSSGSVIGQAGGGAFNIGSGTITTNDLGSGSIVSGLIASGQVGTGHLSSGTQFNGPSFFYANCVENISGSVLAVAFTSGSFICVAQAGSGLRLPAVGVSNANVLSGNPVQVFYDGVLQTNFASGWSGQSPGLLGGNILFCGSGGLLITLSGANGGMKSGYAFQRIGIPFSGGLLIQPDTVLTSGPSATPFAAPALV